MIRIAPRRLLALALVAGLMTVVGVGAAISSATAGSRPSTDPHHTAAGADGLTAGRLLEIAERTAGNNGDPHPYEIEAVRTTRGAAGRVIWPGAGDGADPTPVYAITMRGRFTAYQALLPAGAHFPTGTVISIVVAAAGRLRGEILDFNLTTRPEPDLARLGPVVHLNLHAATSPASRASTFISLWPACACSSKPTFLDMFSLKTGRRLGTVAEVHTASSPDVSVSVPAARPGGPVLLTFSSGPRCAAPPGGGVSSGPCDPLPDSCSSQIKSLDPSTGRMSTLLTIPSSTTVTDAVPSPDGREMVMSTANCATSYFDQNLVVRDLATSRQWSIGADAPRCHELGEPAWNDDGSQLVFPYGPSILPRGTQPSTSESCSTPRYSRLAVVSARHPSASTSWKLIHADKGCSFEAAAFDRQGIAAAEGCRQQGSRAGYSEPTLGHTYLLQLNHHDRVITRVALEPGWEQGAVSTMRDGTVLVSQDQPANESYPERNWVWEFDGHHLRAIAHYAANDAAQVIAVPW